MLERSRQSSVRRPPRGAVVIGYVAVVYAMTMGFILTLVYGAMGQPGDVTSSLVLHSSATHWLWASLSAVTIGVLLSVAARRVQRSVHQLARRPPSH